MLCYVGVGSATAPAPPRGRLQPWNSPENGAPPVCALGLTSGACQWEGGSWQAAQGTCPAEIIIFYLQTPEVCGRPRLSPPKVSGVAVPPNLSGDNLPRRRGSKRLVRGS